MRFLKYSILPILALTTFAFASKNEWKCFYEIGDRRSYIEVYAEDKYTAEKKAYRILKRKYYTYPRKLRCYRDDDDEHEYYEYRYKKRYYHDHDDDDYYEYRYRRYDRDHYYYHDHDHEHEHEHDDD